MFHALRAMPWCVNSRATFATCIVTMRLVRAKGSKPQAETATWELGSRESGPRAERVFAGRAQSGQEKLNSPFHDRVVETSGPFQKCLPDRHGQHTMECEAIKNESSVALDAGR